MADCGGDMNDLLSILDERGFIVQEGELRYLDVLKLCSEGQVDSCMGNHAGAPYAVCLLPPAPDQDPSEGQEPPAGYIPCNPDNYPANISFVAPGFAYKLRPDEAVLIIGNTPPPARYFSFRSYLGFVQNKPNKDYSQVFTTGDDIAGVYHRVYASLGDALNNLDICTANTPAGAAGDPFSSSTIIISTADRCMNEQVRDALGVAGFSADIMNDDNIPAGLVNMGLEKGKDHFSFMMRAIVWAEAQIGAQYLNNLSNFVKVLRITPRTPFANLNPWPVPTLKARETDTTEFQVVPNAVNDLDCLRTEIIKKYGSSEYDHVDLALTNWHEGYEGIFMDVDTLADNRDAQYLKTNTFQLTTDDDFLILYGINHVQTGKAIFCNSSFYGAELINGVAAANISVEFQNSAAEYFPEGFEDAKYYYVCKMARKIDGDNIVILIPYSTGNPSGSAFGVDNNTDALLWFRSYVDPETHVGPALFSIIWDRAILFRKKSKCKH